MATLQHGDKVSVYYNNAALLQAYEAAADSGDVITLSDGYFSAPSNIQKSLSIIGNGFVTDEKNGIYPTILTGKDLIFEPRNIINEDGEMVKEAISINGTRLEGLCINIDNDIAIQGERTAENIQLIKCMIASRWTYLRTNTNNFTIRQCVFTNGFFASNKHHYNLYITNSYIDYFTNSIEYDGTFFVDHSIIKQPSSLATFTNCIFQQSPYNGSNISHSIFINNNGNSHIGTGNWYSKAFAGIFEEEMSELKWDGTKTFKLKYPETYIGTDGTQVGLYGGHYPFNPTPTIPQITECQIDDATAHDGKLKVNITVKAQTED